MFVSHLSPILVRSTIRFFSNSTKFKTIKLTDKPKFPLLKRNARVFSNSGLYNILLDDRLLLTPLGNSLSTKSQALANLIFDEFVAYTDKLTCFNDLPYTMLLSNSLDLSNSDKLGHINKLKNSINTDTLLFFDRVDLNEHKSTKLPDLDDLNDSKLESIRNLDLNIVQTFFFNPILECFSKHFNVSPIVTTDNISKIPTQNCDTLSVLNSFLDSLNTFQLISTLNIHHNFKSIMLTILFLNELVSSRRALRVSRIEETVQSSHWGVTDTFEYEEARILSQVERSLNFYKLNS